MNSETINKGVNSMALRFITNEQINDGVNMDIIATIKHNDPEIDERVSLGIVAEDGGFAIRTATGEDAGQYRWTTEGAAKAAIAHLWSAGAWDLQWEI